jgi:dihydroorotate dehydrogenase (fumarate)
MSFDLSTKYGSLTLKSPVIVGACPLTAEEMIRVAMVNSGAGAIVLPSLFEEQVILWNDRHGLAMGTSPRETLILERAKRLQLDTMCKDADSYLSLVRLACSHTPIPVIASLNGECSDNWLEFAAELETAGVDAVELNVRNPPPSEFEDPREVEDAIIDSARKFNERLKIPLFIKLNRHYTSIGHLSRRLLADAQGLVLFGRSPTVDIQLDSFQMTTRWGLTEPGSIALSLESIMRVHTYCPEMSLAASGGIGNSCDLIKALLAGADVAMVTSSIYRDGATVIGTLIEGLIHFMERHHMQSLEELKSQRPVVFESDKDRLEYIKAFSSRINPDQVCRSGHIAECDRWGHPRPTR